MPILILNSSEEPRGLVVGDRVLIGRRPFNTVMVPDPAVSRIHAWIKRRDGGKYVLYDAGSRSGTLLNGELLAEPRVLAEGDEIRVGPVMMTYSAAEALPAGVAAVEPPGPPPAADPYDGGIYFDCACGGPMWVTADLAGATGRCRYCGERLVVPHASGTVARPVAPSAAAARAATAKRRKLVPPAPPPPAPPVPPAAAPRVRPPAPPMPPAPVEEPVRGAAAPVIESRAVESATPPAAVAGGGGEGAMEQSVVGVAVVGAPCSICQTDILASEERTVCPSCHLQFHAQCWEENYGCSAYGCDQVNVLAPPEERAAMAAGANGEAVAAGAEDDPAAAAAAATPMPAMPGSTFPWDSVLLALSFVALGLGALAFGVPSGIMLLVTLTFLFRRGLVRRRSLVVGAVVVSLAGVVAGYATSMLWWKGQRVWETFLR